MIEVIGGPLDGTTLNRNPLSGQPILLSPDGREMRKMREGVELYIEEGLCMSCGARVGQEPPRRRYLLDEMATLVECELCGEKMTTTLSKDETHDRQD